MLQEPENVFEIKLDEEGIARLRQTLFVTRLMLIVGAIEMVTFAVDSVLLQMWFASMSTPVGDSMYSFLMTYIYPVYSVLYPIFYIAFLAYFFKYSRRANASIVNQSSHQFNESFRFLSIAMRMIMIVVIINLGIRVAFFSSQLEVYKKLLD